MHRSPARTTNRRPPTLVGLCSDAFASMLVSRATWQIPPTLSANVRQPIAKAIRKTVLGSIGRCLNSAACRVSLGRTLHGAVDGHRMQAAVKQRPQRGLAEVLYARIPHRRLGGGGLERARHLLTLSQIVFGFCIKLLTRMPDPFWVLAYFHTSGRSDFRSGPF
jgi:hypothetical protein